MGRIFRIYFDLTPDYPFYLCNTCGTHVAFAKHIVYRSPITDEYQQRYFAKVSNAIIDGPKDYFRNGVNILANVHCVGCYMVLGWKIIQVGIDNEGPEIAGAFDLNLARLYFWDGNLFRLSD